MDYDFPIILGILTPSDELIFFRGVGIPPNSIESRMNTPKTGELGQVNKPPYGHEVS